MRRRDFITLLGGAAAWPLAVRAQQPERMRRIGVLSSLPEDDTESVARRAVFEQTLQGLGWTEYAAIPDRSRRVPATRRCGAPGRLAARAPRAAKEAQARARYCR